MPKVWEILPLKRRPEFESGHGKSHRAHLHVAINPDPLMRAG
jgi:hypothetical protein